MDAEHSNLRSTFAVSNMLSILYRISEIFRFVLYLSLNFATDFRQTDIHVKNTISIL